MAVWSFIGFLKGGYNADDTITTMVHASSAGHVELWKKAYSSTRGRHTSSVWQQMLANAAGSDFTMYNTVREHMRKIRPVVGPNLPRALVGAASSKTPQNWESLMYELKQHKHADSIYQQLEWHRMLGNAIHTGEHEMMQTVYHAMPQELRNNYDWNLHFEKAMASQNPNAIIWVLNNIGSLQTKVDISKYAGSYSGGNPHVQQALNNASEAQRPKFFARAA